ncbi:TSUP family transporter [Pimelobacter simplex]|uniref:TSUP family transporter n=1 Tax=Nocardioides simplex TaxID=2045 RepID=UPI001C20B15A|nr:TSUP family transporter [Pimelobacter simplex]
MHSTTEASELLLLVAAGGAAGAVNALAGGGSLISFPALLATGMPPVTANVTNTAATVPGYFGSCLGYRRELRGQGSAALVMTVASVVGAVAGSALLLVTPAALFRGLSPWLVMGAAALLAAQPALARRWTSSTPETGRTGATAVAAQLVVGVYGGYFAAGLGILMLAALGLFRADDTHRLNALKAVLSLAVGAVSTAWFAAFADIAWSAALILSVSGLLGGLAGARFARRLNPDVLRLAVVGSASRSASSSSSEPRKESSDMQNTHDLPDREELVIRDADVVTMDPELGTVTAVDLHLADGVIKAIGKNLEVPRGTTTIDAAGWVVLPGFIDTHWHLWNTLMRGTVHSTPGCDYFSVKRAFAPYLEPDDFYWSARFALAEAVLGGYTAVHNWDHNVRGGEDVDANIQAHLDSGLRGRFSFGPRDSLPADELMDLDGLREMLVRWSEQRREARISFGVALRGPHRTPPAVFREEWAAARELGLPITLHCDRCMREPGCASCNLTLLEDEGLLGPDVQIVHAVHASEDDVAALARTGTRVSVSPVTEMQTMGFPPVADFLRAGVPVSLSVDTLAMPTAADPVGQMRTVLSVEAARAGAGSVTAAQALAMATTTAAADLGIERVAGSLRAGKKADLVLLAPGVNRLPDGEPIEGVVFNGHTRDIDTVIADGRVLKRGGRLMQESARQAIDEGMRRRDRLLLRAQEDGVWPTTTTP